MCTGSCVQTYYCFFSLLILAILLHDTNIYAIIAYGFILFVYCILIFSGKFYRAEKQLLLQGILSEWWAGRRNIVELGPCPIEHYKSKLKCPPHDPNCGCHGPIMTKGMVAWAGGAHGPDFFINTFVSNSMVDCMFCNR